MSNPGSARFQRAGDRILRSRTFLEALIATKEARFVHTVIKVCFGRMPKPARCKRALPSSSVTRQSYDH